MANKQRKLVVGITAEGSVNLILGQLSYFKSLGYQTYLLAPYSERSAQFCKDEGCEHLVINIEREISIGKDIKTLFQIIKIFRKIKPDIVNLGTPKVSLLGMIAAFILRVPKRIYTCRGFRFEHEKGVKKEILIFLERLTALCATKIVCISPSLRTYGIDKRIFSINKAIVINRGSSNGIDLNKYSTNPDKEKFAEEFLINNGLLGKFIFGFAGRLVEDKGIYELLKVFDNIQRFIPDVKLMIFGTDITSTKKDKEFISNYSFHPNIQWMGFKENLEFYIPVFDVFVLPTYREGFGNVYIQCAAMGVPCIGSDIVGAKDAVSSGFNGILIEPRNEVQLKTAMIKLIEDSELRKRLGENGRIWAQNFDRNMIWNEMHKIYQE